MKRLLLFLAAAALLGTTACKKSTEQPNGPRTEVPEEIRGNFMYGNFSMTEYWNQNPADYLRYGFEVAFAFTFNADGTYTEYFTGSTVTNGVKNYTQSVSKGTVEVNPETKTIKTHPSQSHYKITNNGRVVQEADWPRDKLTTTIYTYSTGVEQNGTQALYMTLEGSQSPLKFLKMR